MLVVPDVAMSEALAAIEDIILVTSESMQVQTLAAALRTLAILLVPGDEVLGKHLAEITRRALSSLGEHVLTSELEAALDSLAAALVQTGHPRVGAAVRLATAELAKSIGALNSRSTRVPQSA